MPPDAPSGDPADLAALRRRTIAGLAALILAPPAPPDAGLPVFGAAHDPALLRRSEAVTLLGRFSDPEAAAVLEELLLHGEARLPAPAGRWLRDTALLTLLRSSRLPAAAVDAALTHAYSFLRQPWPWQWSAVYDDLPLLARYGRLGVFFRAFWLWPLLLLAVPAGLLARQLIDPTPLVPGFAWLDVFITLGAGLEIYLVHQVVVALLCGRGALLALPHPVGPRGKVAAGVLLALIVLALLVLSAGVVLSGCFQVSVNGVSSCALTLQGVALALPLALLPLFLLAHDLEQAARAQAPGTAGPLGAVAAVLRRLTDVIYIVVLPLLAGGVWGTGGTFRVAALAYLGYLLVVPFLVAGALWLLTGLLARLAGPPR